MRKNRQKLLWVIVGFLWLNALLLTAGHAQDAWKLDPQLETAILKEDWQTVIKRLGSNTNLSPAAAFVKAHAYLALNKNNESLCLFLGNSSKTSLQKWEQWTQAFAKKHPQQAIAHYFMGDALARLQQWDTALSTRLWNFTQDMYWFSTAEA
jgi:hypothetical protein